MKKIDIFFINYKTTDFSPIIHTSEQSVVIKLNVYKLSNLELLKQMYKINDFIQIYDQIKRINLIFSKNISSFNANKILTKLNDLLYRYYPITKQIKIYQVNNESVTLMDEISKYKDIVMDPNKNPETYLKFVLDNIPSSYNVTVKKLTDDGIFPLTRAVGMGSNYDSYFVHIKPKTINSNNKDIFLIGKAVTYDAGGLNIKTSSMEEMKIDMTGSALILSVLKLLSVNNFDSNLNIHLLLPIVENMVSSKSIKPGSVVKTMSGKRVEIVNTDAEGRLCIADCLDWINQKLITNPNNSLIIDIATLTGNTMQITSGISSILMANKSAVKYADLLITIGEEIGEYLDNLKIRDEYFEMLKSQVADIKNLNSEVKAGCIIGGSFISYFTNNKVPWLHVDLGVATFVNSTPLSYGINLLYIFLKLVNNKKY